MPDMTGEKRARAAEYLIYSSRFVFLCETVLGVTSLSADTACEIAETEGAPRRYNIRAWRSRIVKSFLGIIIVMVVPGYLVMK
jgi:hypothetical protein